MDTLLTSSRKPEVVEVHRTDELSRPGRPIKEDGERWGIIVIPLSSFYLSKWSTCNYFLHAFLHASRRLYPLLSLLPTILLFRLPHSVLDALYDHQRRGSFADLRLSKL